MTNEFGKGYRWGVASSLLGVAGIVGALEVARRIAPLFAGGDVAAALFFACIVCVPFGVVVLAGVRP